MISKYVGDLQDANEPEISTIDLEDLVFLATLPGEHSENKAATRLLLSSFLLTIYIPTMRDGVLTIDVNVNELSTQLADFIHGNAPRPAIVTTIKAASDYT